MSMKCPYACHSSDHLLSRRSFVAGSIAGLGGALAATPLLADQIKAKHKRILNIFMHGGVRQLESWDPKPNTDTGGPFRAIPTSVPRMHICELLPYTARQMHHLALVRSLNTKNHDHCKGHTDIVTAGRRRTADTDAYTFSYDQAADLLAQREVFDVTKEPAADHDRYGKHEFGQHCLLARRLLERGIPFVQINHSNYDTHFENFDFHIEQFA